MFVCNGLVVQGRGDQCALQPVGRKYAQVVRISYASRCINLFTPQFIHQETDAFQLRSGAAAHALQGHDDNALRQQGRLLQ